MSRVKSQPFGVLFLIAVTALVLCFTIAAIPRAFAQGVEEACGFEGNVDGSGSLPSNARYEDVINVASLSLHAAVHDVNNQNDSDCDRDRVQYGTMAVAKTVLGETPVNDAYAFSIENADQEPLALQHGEFHEFSFPPPTEPIVISEDNAEGLVLWDILCTPPESGKSSYLIGDNAFFEYGDTSVTLDVFSGDFVECEFVNVSSAISVVKDDASTSYTPGTTSIYTITVQAALGGFDAYGITLTDILPEGATLVGEVACEATGQAQCEPLDADDPCLPIDTEALPDSAIVVENCGFIPADGDSQLVYSVEVLWAADTVGEKTNVATIASTTQVRDATDSDTNSRLSKVDLSVEKTALAEGYVPGEPTRFAIEVRNTGPSVAWQAVLSDPLPNGVESATWQCDPAASAPATCPSPSAGTGALEVRFDLGVDQTLVFYVDQVVASTFSDTLENVASVSPGPQTEDTDWSNNQATATLESDTLRFGELEVVKTTDVTVVSRLDYVRYRVETRNVSQRTLTNFTVVDIMPAGFNYIEGTTTAYNPDTNVTLDVEPSRSGRELRWHVNAGQPDPVSRLGVGERLVLEFTLQVGGVLPIGEYPNTALAQDRDGIAVTEPSIAIVRLEGDFFDCSTLIGQVFWDENLDGYQDPGEGGVPGAVLYDVKGNRITVDDFGRYHIACQDIGNFADDVGSSFILKLDEGTLPLGSTLTSENPRVVRLTQGKMTQLNFGVARRRGIEVALDQCNFVGQGVGLHAASQGQLETLLEMLNGLDRPSLNIQMTTSQGQRVLAQQRLAWFVDLVEQADLRAPVDVSTSIRVVAEDQLPTCQAGAVPPARERLSGLAEDECPRLPTIYFDFDRHEVRPDQVQKLAESVEIIRRSSCKTLIVEGHTDLMGSNRYNDELSYRRAFNTAQMLERFGQPAESMKLSVLGETSPASTTFAIAAPIELNRRVHLRLSE